jgi:hypothetical protein
MALTTYHEHQPLREHPMKSRFDFDREGAVVARSVRALVATLCVLALVGLTLFHAGDDGWINAGFVEATQPATDDPAATSGFLHAPTSDPSLPSLEATRFPDDVTPAAEAAPASTF